MTLTDFLIIFIVCTITMWACRVLPIFLLKGRQLPESVVQALGFIPPAAFAALVTNDLIDPAKIASGDISTWLPNIIAAAVVFAVALKSKSMVACVIVGVVALAAIMYVPGLLL